MAKIPKGILGGISGLVGTVVGATFRTLDIIRSRPKKSNKAPVQTQINQRSKFGLVTEMMSRIKGYIDEGFKPKSALLTALNTAVQYNLNNAVTGEFPNFEIDYPKMRISNGKMTGVEKATVTAVAEGNVTVTWDTDDYNFLPVEKLIRAKDSARLLLYNEMEDSFMMTGYELRPAGLIESRAPSANPGDRVHAYLFFVAEDGESSSRSIYLGAVIMLA